MDEQLEPFGFSVQVFLFQLAALICLIALAVLAIRKAAAATHGVVFVCWVFLILFIPIAGSLTALFYFRGASTH